MLNKVMLIGRLGQKPELRYTSTGKAVANLSIVTNNVWYDNNGLKQEQAIWHTAVVWEEQAKHCSNYLEKGSKVYVEGEMYYEKAEKDNTQYVNARIKARVVTFLDPPKNNNQPEVPQATLPENNENTSDNDDMPF